MRIADIEAITFAIAQCGLDHMPQMSMIDYDLSKASALEILQMVFDQRLAACTQQGFGLASVSGRMRSPRPAARIMALNLNPAVNSSFFKFIHDPQQFSCH